MIPEASQFPRRILILEDNPDTVRVISTILKKQGIDVISRNSGCDAEAVIEASQVDAVVTDLLMPNREGLETIRALHALFPELPLLVLSGYEYARMAIHFGACRVLHKPVQGAVLLEALRESGPYPLVSKVAAKENN